VGYDPEQAETVVHNRGGDEVVACEELRHRLLVLVVSQRDEIGFHQFANEGVPWSQNQIAK
jgi:hypothetical protein